MHIRCRLKQIMSQTRRTMSKLKCRSIVQKNIGLNALLAPYFCRRSNFGPLTKKNTILTPYFYHV